MIKAVLFDLEGTLTDTERINREGYRYAAEQLGIGVDAEEHLSFVVGRNRRDIAAYFRDRYGEAFPFDRYVELRRNFVDDAVARDGVPLKAGVPEIFPQLRALGCRIALASSTNSARVGNFLQRAALTDCFDVILTGDCVEHGKPAPDIYLLAAERLGCARGHCLVVEDSVNGVRAGLAAGMHTVMIPDLAPCPAELASQLWACLPDLPSLCGLIQLENKNDINGGLV